MLPTKVSFVHLHCHSQFSFLDGASTVEELVKKTAECEMDALAITDHDNLCAFSDFRRIADRYGVKAIAGVEFTLQGGYHILALARGDQGWANLCTLLSRSHLKNERNNPRLNPEWLKEFNEDLFFLSGCRRGDISALLLQGEDKQARHRLDFYRSIAGPRFFLEIQPSFLPGDRMLHKKIQELAEETGTEMVASNNVHYANKRDFWVHDLLTCVRTQTPLTEPSPHRPLNAENYLKPPEVMERYFRGMPEAVRNTSRIASVCESAPSLGQRHHPSVEVPSDSTSKQYLRRLVYEGAGRRYSKITSTVRERLEHELGIINQMGYVDYFILVEDVVRFARSRGIRYLGRGSAADSAVAYCLGITQVDAVKRDHLFERFMSPERGEKPDIDIDFDARRRDEVIDYVYKKHGHERVARIATYQTFRARSAVRELGKIMGYPKRQIDTLAKTLPGGSSAKECRHLIQNLPEFANRSDDDLQWKRFEKLFSAVKAVGGLPRHLGTHLGGLVISDVPLAQITPLQWSGGGEVITQFDKEGVEDLGLVKLDLLSLRTLSAVEDTVCEIKKQHPDFDCRELDLEDPDTFDMIGKGQTVGVFQLESPAQRALQTRLQANCLEDIISSVALIRPGPIKGDMVEPFIARRRGDEPITYPHPSLRSILKKTYGVILFQEQVIETAVQVAGFTPGEADRLRRVMSRSRPGDEMEKLRKLFVNKAQQRGVDQEMAGEIFLSIEGYASYGFCEAHAAAFATLAYKTAYLLCHFPAEYLAALLTHSPMGYYPPNTLCVEARSRGVRVLPVNINHSGARFTVENGDIRISLAQVKEMTQEGLNSILQARKKRAFSSFSDYWGRTELDRDITENLILAGAFSDLHPNRRSLLWRLPQDSKKNLLSVTEEIEDFSLWEKLRWERKILRIDSGGRMFTLLRPRFEKKGIITVKQVQKCSSGRRIKVAGAPVRPHRPPTRSGKTVVFLSLQDETGLIDVTIFSRIYERYGQLLFSSRPSFLVIEGKVQRRGRGVSIIAEKISPLSEINSPR